MAAPWPLKEISMLDVPSSRGVTVTGMEDQNVGAVFFLVT